MTTIYPAVTAFHCGARNFGVKSDHWMNLDKINIKMKPILVMLGLFLLVFTGREIVDSGKHTAESSRVLPPMGYNNCMLLGSLFPTTDTGHLSSDNLAALPWQKESNHQQSNLSGKQYVINGIVF